jgi:LysM repeat protein
MIRLHHLAHIAAAVALAGACIGLAEEPAWSKTPTKTAMAPKTAPARTYVVRTGDNWWQIAHSHGTTLPHLLAANHATMATPVNVGAKIKLPADAKADPKTTAAHAPQAKRTPTPAPAKSK